MAVGINTREPAYTRPSILAVPSRVTNGQNCGLKVIPFFIAHEHGSFSPGLRLSNNYGQVLLSERNRTLNGKFVGRTSTGCSSIPSDHGRCRPHAKHEKRPFL